MALQRRFCNGYQHIYNGGSAWEPENYTMAERYALSMECWSIFKCADHNQVKMISWLDENEYP